MPPLPADLLLDGVTSQKTALSSAESNATNQTFQVVCAWPVSGQYGAGARILYYVLIVACIFARKTEWLRNACLAAALLFPAVAALHGIVLAASHVDAAVDMDIYGTLQLCAIGALAAPLTARRSETYFKTPGRNTIFLWAAIVLAGLLSLAVEFYRSTDTSVTTAQGCTRSDFRYGTSKCNMTCDTTNGPFSPIRGGSANNIDVIIAPHIITFNAAMLLAAACCIPAILLLISLSIQIFETETQSKSKKANGTQKIGEQLTNVPGRRAPKNKLETDAEIETFENSETDLSIQSENVSQSNISQQDAGVKSRAERAVRWFQRNFEVPVFGGAVLVIVVIGERNFFSRPVKYDTEPMANVGQWSPIAGIVLTIFGSVYLLLAEAIEYERNPEKERERYLQQARDRKPSDLALRGARYSMKFGGQLRKRFHGDQNRSSEAKRRVNELPEIPGEQHRNPQAGRIRAASSADRSRSPARSEHSSAHCEPIPNSPTGSALARRETLDIPSSQYGRSPSLDADRISLDITESPDPEPASLLLQHTPSALSSSTVPSRKRTQSYPVYSGHAATDDGPETPAIMITPESRAASRRPSLAMGVVFDGRGR